MLPLATLALSDEYLKPIRAFYESDEISCAMPGKKDCVSMYVNGMKELVQKRFILCNVKEAYKKVKDDHKIKVAFSKVTTLQPKNVVLAGGGGHTVFVYVPFIKM